MIISTKLLLESQIYFFSEESREPEVSVQKCCSWVSVLLRISSHEKLTGWKGAISPGSKWLLCEPFISVPNAAMRELRFARTAASILPSHSQGQWPSQGQEQGTKADRSQAMPPPTELRPTVPTRGEQSNPNRAVVMRQNQGWPGGPAYRCRSAGAQPSHGTKGMTKAECLSQKAAPSRGWKPPQGSFSHHFTWADPRLQLCPIRAALGHRQPNTAGGEGQGGCCAKDHEVYGWTVVLLGWGITWKAAHLKLNGVNCCLEMF